MCHICMTFYPDVPVVTAAVATLQLGLWMWTVTDTPLLVITGPNVCYIWPAL